MSLALQASSGNSSSASGPFSREFQFPEVTLSVSPATFASVVAGDVLVSSISLVVASGAIPYNVSLVDADLGLATSNYSLSAASLAGLPAASESRIAGEYSSTGSILTNATLVPGETVPASYSILLLGSIEAG